MRIDEFEFQDRNGNEIEPTKNQLVVYVKSLHKQIAELEKQLAEKEKDNQFFKKMYLSEKTKNDNYRTEKYGLDKPVEELRKIKLTPKEKEIYYKGFDNCERQFATHIAELQQQIEKKEKSLEYFRERVEKAEKEIKDNYKQYNQLVNEYNELITKLQSQPAEIVEKIRNLAEKDFDFDTCTCCGEDVHDDVVLTKSDFNKILENCLTVKN